MRGDVGKRDGLNAGQVGDGVFQAMMQGHLLRRGVARGGWIDAEEQQVFRAEAGADAVEVDERGAGEEDGGDDQQRGEARPGSRR